MKKPSELQLNRKLPVWGWCGFILIAIFWPVNWLMGGTRTIWAFFPLWTGFSLIVDGLVFFRTGTSQIQRSKPGFISLFLISAPSWWLFEYLNHRVQNWYYAGVEGFTNYEFFLLSTLNFSTVMPAIFGSAELISSFDWPKRVQISIRIPRSNRSVACFFIIGLIMLTLLLIWPVIFFPFMWLSIYFILEPINLWLGNPSLFDFADKKEWRPVLFLFLGALLTGFFWEFWNYFSYPKWIYTIPYLNFKKIFEMPIFGYFGYLPFSLELSAIFQLVNRVVKNKNAGLFPIFERICESKA